MSTSKSSIGKRSLNNSSPKLTGKSARLASDVLTASAVGDYLRVPETAVVRLAQAGELPGRQIDKEWRFLKSALQDWLRNSARKTGKEAFLALAGSWKDDPDIEQIVHDALRRRRQAMSEFAK